MKETNDFLHRFFAILCVFQENRFWECVSPVLVL